MLVTLGLIFGMPLALAATRWIKSYLFRIPPLDPIAVSVVVGGLVTVSAVAAYLPARRATKVDPVAALRSE